MDIRNIVENIMERIKLFYATEDSDEEELPFRILVLGDFTLQKPEILEHDQKAFSVDLKNFNTVIVKHNILLNLMIPNHLYKNDKPMEINIPIGSMQDFKPDALLAAIPEMKQLIDLKRSIHAFKKTGSKSLFDINTLEEGQKVFLNSVGFDDSIPDDNMLNIASAYIAKRLCEQLDEIIHHKKFQHIESIWRGLFFLAGRLGQKENCSIDILNVSKQQLKEDFEYWKDISNSFLFKKVYTEAFGNFGGKPYGVIIADYFFDHSAEEIDLLKNIGMVAKISNAPFIAGAHPNIFGEKYFSDISNAGNLKDVFEGAQYAKWHQLRSSGESEYVGLTLPRFLLRSTYNDIYDRAENIAYDESPCYLWGNSSFAFGACLLENFKKYRWCLHSAGPKDGKAPDIKGTRVMSSVSDQEVMPVEIFISEKMEADLSEAGFIPLSIQKGAGCAFFNSANSIKSPIIASKSKQEIVDARLAVHLPYTFIVCRLVHYIKIIQRDNIGSIKDRLELEKELNSWLVQYVSDMDNPTQAVRTRRPLRKAYVKVDENKEKGNVVYMISLTVTPHYRYLGATFALSLQTRIG